MENKSQWCWELFDISAVLCFNNSFNFGLSVTAVVKDWFSQLNDALNKWNFWHQNSKMKMLESLRIMELII